MSFPSQIPVGEAIAFLRKAAPRGEVETVPLEFCLGRVLARDLTSLVDHPSVDNSALDGFACRLEDTLGAEPDRPVSLSLIGEVAAGGLFGERIGPGQAVAIYTGAAIPAGADAIVPVEATRQEGSTVWLEAPGRHEDIRPRGQDLHRGVTYLRAGTTLHAGGMGLVAAMGHERAEVTRKPRVGILATGDEVVPPGRPLEPGQVYNANTFSIAGLVQAAGGQPVMLPPVADDLDRLREVLAGMGGLDLLLTSGGVSMGRYDFVRDLLFEHGRVVFWKVAMKPGGPVLFGHWQDLPVLGLPGNPVSAMVAFVLLARAFLDTFLASAAPLPYAQRLTAEAGSEFRASGFKETFPRVVLDERGVARSAGDQSSGVLRSMVEGTALGILPPHSRILPGQPIEVISLAPHLGGWGPAGMG